MALLEVRNLSVRYGGVTAVEGATLSIEAGELLGIIGPNGAGKTSLLNAISGVAAATTGNVILAGRDITRVPLRRRINLGIARTFQGGELFRPLDVIENLMIGRDHLMRTTMLGAGIFLGSALREEIAHREKVEEVIEFLQLQRFRRAAVGSLPFALQKIVGLGRALCAEPRLLLLDEVASGLTHEEKMLLSHHVIRINEELKITVAWVEHDVRLVRDLSSRVIALHYGRQIACGSPEEVLSSDAVRQSFFGANLDE